MAQIIDRHRIEALHHFLVELGEHRAHHLLADLAAAIEHLFFARFKLADNAHDLARRDAPPLARQAITAAGPAHAAQNAGAHKLLHHLFEIALGNALTLRQLLRLHGLGARVVGDIDHRLESEERFFRKSYHVCVPVEPKPPAPRTVSSRSSTAVKRARVTGAMTSWAMRMPRSITAGVSLKFMRMTLTSPR